MRPCSVYYTHGEPPLRERRVSPIFPDRVSFYLSERVELSNTARLSFSATSPPPYIGPTTNALSPDRCTLRLENSRARLCTRGSPPDRSLSYQLSSISLPSNRPSSSPRRSARRCARETVNSLDRPELAEQSRRMNHALNPRPFFLSRSLYALLHRSTKFRPSNFSQPGKRRSSSRRVVSVGNWC